MQQIRLAYPKQIRIYRIQDGLSSHWTPAIRAGRTTRTSNWCRPRPTPVSSTGSRARSGRSTSSSERERRKIEAAKRRERRAAKTAELETRRLNHASVRGATLRDAALVVRRAGENGQSDSCESWPAQPPELSRRGRFEPPPPDACQPPRGDEGRARPPERGQSPQADAHVTRDPRRDSRGIRARRARRHPLRPASIPRRKRRTPLLVGEKLAERRRVMNLSQIDAARSNTRIGVHLPCKAANRRLAPRRRRPHGHTRRTHPDGTVVPPR